MRSLAPSGGGEAQLDNYPSKHLLHQCKVRQCLEDSNLQSDAGVVS